MKILHLSGARIWGGNEQQLKYLVTELNGKGVKQFLFCYVNTPVAEIAKSQNLDVIAIDYLKPYKKAYWQALTKAVKDVKPDIIHLHTSDSVTGYMLTDVFFGLKAKVVFSKKGISRKMTFLSRIKYNYKGIDRIVCVSRQVREEFEKIIYTGNRKKLMVIPDGFEIDKNAKQKIPVPNLRKELDLSPDIKIIGNISNHTEAKDLPALIETLKYLVNSKGRKDLHLVQFGKETKLTPGVKQKIKELNLEGHISFLGFQKYASSIYPQFDVFLITSKKEGGPSSVFEAFYLKTPVVTTKVGIIPEAIEHDKNGLISEIGDYKGLGTSVLRILDNKELATSLTENAYKTVVNKYSSSVLGDKHFKLYNSLLKDEL